MTVLMADAPQSAASAAGADRREGLKKPLEYQLGPREVHPFHAAAAPTHEDIKRSLHYPLIVTPNPMAAPQVFDGNSDPSVHLNINGGPIPFETAAFKGIIVMHFDGLPTTNPLIFKGKRRLTHTAIQGKFKQAMPASELCMGVEFIKAFGSHLPHWQVLMEWGLIALAKRFSRTVKVDAYADTPYAMCPVLAACQLINVSTDGEQPDIMEATEDMRLWEPALVTKQGTPMAADKRRKWADKPSHLEGRTIDCEHVWTFHLMQHFVDYARYRIRPAITGGLVSVDVAAALEAHPLQMTVKCLNTGEYVFSVLVWHERLLYGKDTDGVRGQLVLAELAEKAANVLKLAGSIKRFFAWPGSDAARVGKPCASAPVPLK